MAGTLRQERLSEALRHDVAAALAAADLEAHAVNEYGSVVAEGYKAEDSLHPDAARVSHRLPESDLSDPYRMSSDERWWVRLGMLARYAQVLRQAGFEVEASGIRGGTFEPWLIVRRDEGASGD